MTKYRRVVPALLLSDGYLVKPLKFGKNQYIGDPINAVKIFNEMQVDEIFLIDIDPCRHGNKVNFQLVEQIASEAFMPVAYGGGIRDKKTGLQLNRLGIEKVVLGSSSVTNPELIVELSNELGRQGVVACIDYKKKYAAQRVYINGGTKKTALTPEALAKQVFELGAGEILLQSISREGSQEGYDIETLTRVKQAVNLPIAVLGGAGKIEDFKAAFANGASAACAGTMFVTKGPHKAVLINYPEPLALDELRGF